MPGSEYEMRGESVFSSAHLDSQETLRHVTTIWCLSASQLSFQLSVLKLGGKLGMLVLLNDRIPKNGTANLMFS